MGVISVTSAYYENEYPDQSYQEEYQRNIGNNLAKSVPVGLDYATVYNGVFDPNNIAIHVGQNFVNFVAGTAVW